MKAYSPQVIQTAPGRLALVKNNRQRVPVDLTRVLPDGSRLTDPVNRHLLETILGVLSFAEPRVQGASLASVIGGLVLLVQWMFLHSVYRFRNLNHAQYHAFLEDSSKGLDYCIQATSRLQAHLANIQNLEDGTRRQLTVTSIFEGANLPGAYTRRLPALSTLARRFIDVGSRALMAGPQQSPVRRLSVATLRSRVAAVQFLWTAREGLEDPASVPPFTDDIIVKVRKLGSPSRQTPIPPSALAARLMAGSMEAIKNVGPLFISWDATRDATKRGEARHDSERFSQLCLAVQAQWQRTLVTTPNDARRPYLVADNIGRMFIPLSCRVAVSAFVGRRKVEVESLESDCIKGEAQEGRHLVSYIAKRQSFESRPCPEFVAKAVALMNEYQGYKPGDSLPLFKQRGRSSTRPAGTNLNAFAELVGARRYVDAHGRERVWNWQWHQLRRLYAVLYIWRYDDASLLALRHHLGHGSDREAAYYAQLASDGNFADFAIEVQLFTIERLREVVDGVLVGPFAEVLSKRIERAKGSLRIASPSSLPDILKGMVERDGLALHASPWGYCGCKPSSSNLRRAQCMIGRPSRQRHPIFATPIPENSKQEVCGKCHFHCSSASREPHWRDVVATLDRAVASGNPSSITIKLLRERREKVSAAAERIFGHKC